MTYRIPSSNEMRSVLLKLCQVELRIVAEQSGVPFSTVLKIRQGVTRNPGVETVRGILTAPIVQQALGQETASMQAEVPHV